MLAPDVARFDLDVGDVSEYEESFCPEAAELAADGGANYAERGVSGLVCALALHVPESMPVAPASAVCSAGASSLDKVSLAPRVAAWPSRRRCHPRPALCSPALEGLVEAVVVQSERPISPSAADVDEERLKLQLLQRQALQQRRQRQQTRAARQLVSRLGRGL